MHRPIIFKSHDSMHIPLSPAFCRAKQNVLSHLPLPGPVAKGGEPTDNQREIVDATEPTLSEEQVAEMGKSKQTPNLTHEEVWDDAALVRSWDEAVEEYQVRRNISLT